MNEKEKSSGCGWLIVIIIGAVLFLKFGIPNLDYFTSKNNKDITVNGIEANYINFESEASKVDVEKLLDKDMIIIKKEKVMFKKEYFMQTIDKDFDFLYYGDVKDDRPNGKGMILGVSFEDHGKKVLRPVYIGNFKKGRFDGYGRYYVSAGDYYDNYELDKYGLAYKLYEGEFVDNNFDGNGNLYTLNDNILDKSYLESYVSQNEEILTKMDNLFNDNETPYIFPEAPPLEGYIAYSGEIKSNELDGEGVKFSSDGHVVFKGEFKNSLYEGKGILYSEVNKVKYKGEFNSGEYEGKGTLYNNDGTVNYKGEWHNGDIK